jgi:hypothetical protein
MSTTTESPEETVEIRSPYRPLTRGARRALQDAVTVIEELESDERGRNGGVIVDERPPEDVLEDHELEVVRDPVVEYETEGGKPIEIYTDPDAVMIGPNEASMSPAAAVEKAEDSDRFTRTGGNPGDIRG